MELDDIDIVEPFSYQELELILNTLPAPESATLWVGGVDYSDTLTQVSKKFPDARSDGLRARHYITAPQPDIETLLDIYQNDDRLPDNNGLMYSLQKVTWEEGFKLTPHELIYNNSQLEPDYFTTLKQQLLGEDTKLEVTITKR